MSLNKNWGRWCFAAASKYFENNKAGRTLIFEGDDYGDDISQKDRAEFRMDGPDVTELSRGFYRLDFEINLAVSCVRDDIDTHKIHRETGFYASLFKDIPVYKFGDTADDDPNVYVGCLNLRQEYDQKIFITHLGQIEESTRVLQATIEAHYRIQLRS
jgi:hypothetical protein